MQSNYIRFASYSILFVMCMMTGGMLFTPAVMGYFPNPMNWVKLLIGVIIIFVGICSYALSFKAYLDLEEYCIRLKKKVENVRPDSAQREN